MTESREQWEAIHRPEYVPPPRPASPPQAAWGYRVGATLTNIALAVLAGCAAYAIAKATGGSDDAASTAGGLTVLGFWLLNAIVLAALTNGQSLGKLLAGIRVVRESGRRYGSAPRSCATSSAASPSSSRSYG